MMDICIVFLSCFFLSCFFLLVICISMVQVVSYDYCDCVGFIDIVLCLNYFEEEFYFGLEGIKIEVQDEMGFGFGVMYNVDVYWVFGGSFDGSSLDYCVIVIFDSDFFFVYFN